MISPVLGVELASLAVLALYSALEIRSGAWRESLPLGLLLMVAALVGEDTCIRLYGFYHYNPEWAVFLDKVPLMVVVIWPFVIVSDRTFLTHLLGPGHRWLPLATGAMVTYDAFLMEPVATQAGLWTWTQAGLFEVPLIGILGWGFFTAAALQLWQTLKGPARGLMVVVAPLLTHALLLAAWWGGLRWILRGPLPMAGVLTVAVLISCILSAGVLHLRIQLPLHIMAPRVAAASVFFWLLLAFNAHQTALLAYVATFAPPYLLACDRQILRRFRNTR